MANGNYLITFELIRLVIKTVATNSRENPSLEFVIFGNIPIYSVTYSVYNKLASGYVC